jgi:hypothetical protein
MPVLCELTLVVRQLRRQREAGVCRVRHRHEQLMPLLRELMVDLCQLRQSLSQRHKASQQRQTVELLDGGGVRDLR